MPRTAALNSDSLSQQLAIEQVTAGYGGAPILHDVDLSIERGLTILIGPNGCGKSTLLKTMARVLRPSVGRVQLGGQDVHKMDTKVVARQMALLPQGPIAPEGLKVRELVAQGRFPHQSLLQQWSREDSVAVDRAMAATDVVQFADRPVASLSGGQRQRCWIAMVLAQDTPVVLLDEPTTFLDLKVQIDVMDNLRRIADEGRNVVVVLHELNLAAAYADRLVMMRAGRVVADGAPRDVFTSDNLRDVFDLDARIMHDPECGYPICVPHIGGGHE